MRTWRFRASRLFCRNLVFAAVLGIGASAHAQDTLKFGISAPLSGPAASWGLGLQFVGKKAAEHINKNGGIKVAGKTYKVSVLTLDNKYNAADGTKVAQTLLRREGVKFVAAVLGTAPTKATQSLTERMGVLMMTTAWGRSVKGPGFPLTFTQINTPAEVLPQLYAFIKKQHPDAKTVALFNPNDASGKDVEKDAQRIWKELGFEVVISDFFERGTTEFQSVATKIAGVNPDIVDLSSGPPATAGLVFKELQTQGWHGIRVVAAGTGAGAFLKTGGDAVEGTYTGLAADYSSDNATSIQKELNEGAKKELGEPLNVIHMGAWDGVMAIKAGIEAAASTDPKKVAEVLRDLVFDTSYGKSAFGGKDVYGIRQQLLVPTIIAQIKGGKIVEVQRSLPSELKSRIEKAK